MTYKKTIIYIFIVFILALLLREGEPEPYAHWSYEGDEAPKNWSSLDERYEICEKGIIQSPINIISDDAINAKLSPLNFTNIKKAKNFEFNGHALQINFSAGNKVEIAGDTYDLKQIHFHTPSENHIDGKSFPMEAHFVHKKASKIVVIALMFELGEENPFLNKLLRTIPNEEEPKKQLKSEFLPYDILPSSQEYFTFNGSLTTPPCTEGVKWVVLKTPVEFSQDQLKDFTDIINNNNRPIQKANLRFILK